VVTDLGVDSGDAQDSSGGGQEARSGTHLQGKAASDTTVGVEILRTDNGIAESDDGKSFNIRLDLFYPAEVEPLSSSF